MGYFSDEDIKLNHEPPVSSSGTVANAKYVHVRESPSKTGASLGLLYKGEKLEILGLVDGYYKIKYKRHKEAYVAEHFIEEDIG